MVGFYALVKGPYYTLIKRYLNSFVPSSFTVKVYAANSAMDSIVRSLIYLLSSLLLKITYTATALIILGGIFTLIFVLLLDYMKTRVGLDPEEYTNGDIEISS